MGIQLRSGDCYTNHFKKPSSALPSPLLNPDSSAISLLRFNTHQIADDKRQNSTKKKIFSPRRVLGLSSGDGRRSKIGKKQVGSRIIKASSGVGSPLGSMDDWKPEKGSESPSLSDVVWPAAGAFVAMAVLGKMDHMLAPKGVSMSIAPFGAVSAVLFAAPSSAAARKYNMFMGQIGCAAFGVLAFSIFGRGWLAKSTALAAAIAFMIYTRAIHPPAASLPLLFIDGAKLHRLNFWYAFFPGAAGCILLCLIQEVVCYLKENFKF